MNKRIGILGAGHLASYLMEGFHKRMPDLQIMLADCEFGRAERLANLWGAKAIKENQALLDGSDLVILAVRPQDALPACRALAFRKEHVVASAAAGLYLADLEPAVAPARVVRIMPLTSAALNLSPTLVFPENPAVSEAFALLGQVHALPSEASFTAASVIAAFYGWVYALADETVAWTMREGVPEDIARKLVLETIRSTAEMALAKPQQSIQELLDLLATPGGITEFGLGILREHHGIESWPVALNAVLERMNSRR